MRWRYYMALYAVHQQFYTIHYAFIAMVFINISNLIKIFDLSHYQLFQSVIAIVSSLILLNILFAITHIHGFVTDTLSSTTNVRMSGLWFCAAQNALAALLILPHLIIKYTKQRSCVSCSQHRTVQEKTCSNDSKPQK